MNKISLFLTVFLVCVFVSCSSSDDGMRSNGSSVKAEFINTTMDKENTSFNYSVKSTSDIPLDGRLELTTVKGDKSQSDYFTILPNGTVKVSVLVKGKDKGINDIKEQKVYTRPTKVIK